MRRLFWLIALVLVCVPALAENQFKIIALQHRFGQDLVPVLAPLAGPDGTISASGNHLFVNVAPERMEVIEQAVARLDVESRMYRIRVDRSGDTRSSSGGVDVAGRVGNEIRIERSGPQRRRGGVTVEVDRSETATTVRSSESLAVMDGAQAFIAVGRSIPFTEYWAALARRHAHVVETIRYRDIVTGFSVLPRQIGTEVELEITPRISVLNGDGVIEFQELATRIRAMPGTWVDLGDIMQSRDEVSRAILAYSRGDSEVSSRLRVLVE